jgi:hypothetical protein
MRYHHQARDHRGRPVSPWVNSALVALLRAAVAAGSLRMGTVLALLVYDRTFRWCAAALVAFLPLMVLAAVIAHRHTAG